MGLTDLLWAGGFAQQTLRRVKDAADARATHAWVMREACDAKVSAAAEAAALI